MIRRQVRLLQAHLILRISAHSVPWMGMLEPGSSEASRTRQGRVCAKKVFPGIDTSFQDAHFRAHVSGCTFQDKHHRTRMHAAQRFRSWRHNVSGFTHFGRMFLDMHGCFRTRISGRRFMLRHISSHRRVGYDTGCRRTFQDRRARTHMTQISGSMCSTNLGAQQHCFSIQFTLPGMPP